MAEFRFSKTWEPYPRADGRMEWLCEHGIGHGEHSHCCDGCCDDNPTYPGRVVKEKKTLSFVVKDSGARRSFASGAVRDVDDTKPRYDLIPTAVLGLLQAQFKAASVDPDCRLDLLPWDALLAVARHYGLGAKKYGDRNWEKGMPFSTFYASGMRHLIASKDGQTDEDHDAAEIFNALARIAFRIRGRTDLNDTTKSTGSCKHGQ